MEVIILQYPKCDAGLARHASIKHYSIIMSVMASQITSLTIVYSTVYSCTNQRKHQRSASLAFVRGFHQWPVNSPHKGPVTRKMFPFDDVMMKVVPGALCHPFLDSKLSSYSHPVLSWHIRCTCASESGMKRGFLGATTFELFVSKKSQVACKLWEVKIYLIYFHDFQYRWCRDVWSWCEKYTQCSCPCRRAFIFIS